MTAKQPKVLKKRAKKKASANEIEELQDDLGNYIDLQTLHESAGGQMLVEGLVNDIIGAMDALCAEVGDKDTTHMRLVSLICKMKERRDLVSVLTSAKENRMMCEDLLKEALKNKPKG